MSQAAHGIQTGPTESQLAEMIGEEYINGEFPLENSGGVREIYETIGRINVDLFERIPVDVRFTSDDPYDSFDEMKERVKSEGVFYVFDGGSHPEFMTKEQNIKGRAVHDYFGHIGQDVDFSFGGEFKKWDAQKHHYPIECWPVLFAEVVGQVSAAYYLPKGFDSDLFTQRQIMAPERWMNAARRVVQ